MLYGATNTAAERATAEVTSVFVVIMMADSAGIALSSARLVLPAAPLLILVATAPSVNTLRTAPRASKRGQPDAAPTDIAST